MTAVLPSPGQVPIAHQGHTTQGGDPDVPALGLGDLVAVIELVADITLPVTVGVLGFGQVGETPLDGPLGRFSDLVGSVLSGEARNQDCGEQ